MPTLPGYDAENQRIGVNQTRYVVNSQPALSQVLVKESNGIKTFYVYGLGLIGEETGGTYRSYHFDYRGSTIALTDGTGQVTQRFQYAPYGELVSGDATQTPFLFNGMYGVMTDENDLYYMRARFYSPEIKRFVNQDVLLGSVAEGQTLNRFAFVNGNPVSYADPEGKLAWWLIPLIGFGLTLADIATPPTLPEGHEQDAIAPSIGPFDLVTGLGGGLAGLTRGSCQVATSLWKSQLPGIQVRQFGDWWVKRVNLQSYPLMQRWGELSIREQAEALDKLGDMATEHYFRNGLLFTRDVGETLPDGFRLLNPTSRQAYFEGSKRLGTYFNDIQPRNMGKNGLIFDPAIDSVQKGVFFIGVPASTGIGLYITYPE